MLLFAVFFSFNSFGQGAICEEAEPFFTGVTYTFVVPPNNPEPPTYYGYDCLGTAPSPSWYVLQVLDPGDIIITISGVQQHTRRPVRRTGGKNPRSAIRFRARAKEARRASGRDQLRSEEVLRRRPRVSRSAHSGRHAAGA